MTETAENDIDLFSSVHIDRRRKLMFNWVIIASGNGCLASNHYLYK